MISLWGCLPVSFFLSQAFRIYSLPYATPYGVDFIQMGFYVRVIIQDKTEEGLSAAISFAQFIAKRIK